MKERSKITHKDALFYKRTEGCFIQLVVVFW